MSQQKELVTQSERWRQAGLATLLNSSTANFSIASSLYLLFSRSISVALGTIL